MQPGYTPKSAGFEMRGRAPLNAKRTAKTIAELLATPTPYPGEPVYVDFDAQDPTNTDVYYYLKPLAKITDAQGNAIDPSNYPTYEDTSNPYWGSKIEHWQKGATGSGNGGGVTTLESTILLARWQVDNLGQKEYSLDDLPGAWPDIENSVEKNNICHLFLGGIPQYIGVDYMVNPRTITFTTPGDLPYGGILELAYHPVVTDGTGGGGSVEVVEALNVDTSVTSEINEGVTTYTVGHEKNLYRFETLSDRDNFFSANAALKLPGKLATIWADSSVTEVASRKAITGITHKGYVEHNGLLYLLTQTSIIIYNPVAEVLQAPIALTGGASHMVKMGGKLFIGTITAGIHVLRLSDNTIETTITGQNHSVHLLSVIDKVYAVNFDSDSVSVLNVGDETTVASLNRVIASVGNEPSFGLRYGNKTYVTNTSDGTVAVITDADAISTITVGSFPDYLFSAGSFIYCKCGSTLYVIDPSDNSVEKTLDINYAYHSHITAGGYLYVIDSSEGEVQVINPATATVTGSIPTDGEFPALIDNTLFYFGSGTYSIIDTTTRTKIADRLNSFVAEVPVVNFNGVFYSTEDDPTNAAITILEVDSANGTYELLADSTTWVKRFPIKVRSTTIGGGGGNEQPVSTIGGLEPWNPTQIYDTVPSNEYPNYTEYLGRFFKSKGNANVGNTPPSSPNISGVYENEFWIEVSASEAGHIQGTDETFKYNGVITPVNQSLLKTGTFVTDNLVKTNAQGRAVDSGIKGTSVSWMRLAETYRVFDADTAINLTTLNWETGIATVLKAMQSQIAYSNSHLYLAITGDGVSSGDFIRLDRARITRSQTTNAATTGIDFYNVASCYVKVNHANLGNSLVTLDVFPASIQEGGDYYLYLTSDNAGKSFGFTSLYKNTSTITGVAKKLLHFKCVVDGAVKYLVKLSEVNV